MRNEIKYVYPEYNNGGIILRNSNGSVAFQLVYVRSLINFYNYFFKHEEVSSKWWEQYDSSYYKIIDNDNVQVDGHVLNREKIENFFLLGEYHEGSKGTKSRK